MARPRKQTVDYFPHSCTHKTTMFILEQRYGNDGYAFWFKLLEMLGQAEGHYLDLNKPATWEFLQSKTRMTNGSCDEIIGLLARLEAIDAELWEQKVIWCQNFADNIAEAYRNRAVEMPQRPSFQCKKPRATDVSTAETCKKSANEMKLDEMKLDEMSISPESQRRRYGEFQNVLLTDEEFTKLTEKLGYRTGAEIEKLSAYMKSKGKRYKDHYATILSWTRRDDGKAKHSRKLPTYYEPTADYPDL